MGLIFSLIRRASASVSQPRSQTGAHSGQDSGVPPPSSIEATAEQKARRAVFPVIFFIVGVVSLIIGIVRYEDNYYCENPLAVWLIIHASITIALSFTMITRARFLLPKDKMETAPKALIRLSWLCTLLLFLGQVSWLIVGANWTWGISTDSCNNTLYRASSIVLALGFLMITALLVLICKRLIDRRRNAAARLQQLGSPKSPSVAEEDSGLTSPYV